ncbi:hypothetical protein [Endozoicomonas sp. YOMI1]|uniref:hypothetical protein n=1 Tax=Endozoicomonas sp. YOMI1 TaxID=2828739 RepID=UPI0021484389|nr:hypothetical protein [Endozoicomonas sp. YOMI1]
MIPTTHNSTPATNQRLSTVSLYLIQRGGGPVKMKSITGIECNLSLNKTLSAYSLRREVIGIIKRKSRS